eukprot:scaffold14301_cov60-Phaeocystis_antarctica.AAC.1
MALAFAMPLRATWCDPRRAACAVPTRGNLGRSLVARSAADGGSWSATAPVAARCALRATGWQRRCYRRAAAACRAALNCRSRVRSTSRAAPPPAPSWRSARRSRRAACRRSAQG